MEMNSEKLQSQTKKKKKSSVGFSLLSGVVDLQLQFKLLGRSYFLCLSVRLWVHLAAWVATVAPQENKCNAEYLVISWSCRPAVQTACLFTCIILNSCSIFI